ncbi:MAG: hypothetical protein ABEL76_13575, partial [Bradymonadaceae bacterium]
LIDGHPLGVTVEGFWLRPFGRDSALTELFVARGERGPAGTELAYVGSGLFGVAGAVDWEMPWADLGLTLGGLSDLSSGDLVMTGLVHRRWESWLRTGVGYRLFEGPSPDRDLSVGGVYDPNDQFVVTVDGSF